MDDLTLFPYYVRGYYADDVKAPKTPGALAFETKHGNITSRDHERAAAESRKDIGNIEYGMRPAPALNLPRERGPRIVHQGPQYHY